MKVLFSILCLVVASSAFASRAIKVSDNKAVMQICKAIKSNGRMIPAAGCINKIVVKGKAYPFTTEDSDVENTLANIVGTNQFHGLTRSTPFKLEGRVVIGRKMNLVTKILIVDYVAGVMLPKSLPPR